MTGPLFDAFRMAMLNKPDGSRADALAAFMLEMRSRPEYLETLAQDYFDRMSGVWAVDRVEGTYLFRRKDPPRLRAEPATEKAIRKRAVTEALKDMRASLSKILLLDLTLPDGKALRDSTGAECKKAGGFFREVARHLKPQQVVDKHMTEGDLQNIRARFYLRNRDGAGRAA